MKILVLMSIIISSIGFNACNSSKKAAKDNSNAAASNDANNYRLVVEFYSKGGGIDGAALDKFQAMLDARSKKLAFDKMRWGREGECDYCLKLSELSKKEQVEFINEVKKLLASSQLARIEENKPGKGTKIN